MSPVNEVTSDGLPTFFVKDIPPVTSVDISTRQVQTYFGELTDNYVFTKTNSPEFDYPGAYDII